MSERVDTEGPGGESDEAGRPLPDSWIRSMRDAMNQESQPPAATPTDAMWRVIESRIGSERADRPGSDVAHHPRGRRLGSAWAPGPWAWGLAASVILLAGIAIGRGSLAPAAAPGATATTPARMDARVVRDVAARHLVASETLLSFVGVDVARGEVDGELATRGRQLLADTRMLLRVTPAEEVELRSLLGDLELFLAQLALLEGSEFDEARRAEEVGLLGAGLRGSDLLPRIQAALPRLDTRRRPMSATD